MRHFLIVSAIFLCGNVAEAQTVDPTVFNDPTANSVRQTAECLVVVTDTTVTLTISPPSRSAATQLEISTLKLADITVTPASIKLTKTALFSAGKIEASTTFTALPNPSAEGGYALFAQILFQRLNINFLTPSFYHHQMTPLDGPPSALLLSNLFSKGAPLNNWFELPLGINLASTWTADTLMTVGSSFGTRTPATYPLTFSIPSSSFTNLPSGSYWFTIILTMTPFTTPTTLELISSTETILANQIITLNQFVSYGKTLLPSSTNRSTLTVAQTTQVQTNIQTLQNILIQIQKEYTAFYTNLFNQPTTTAAEQAAITASLAALNALYT
jgi:hypothetical protein